MSKVDIATTTSKSVDQKIRLFSAKTVLGNSNSIMNFTQVCAITFLA